jgi:hypothetical protein
MDLLWRPLFLFLLAFLLYLKRFSSENASLGSSSIEESTV